MTLEEKYALYLEDGKALGREEGKKEGRAEGIKEGREETIQSFVESRKKDGYTDEEIAKEVKHIFSIDLDKMSTQ